VCADDFNPAADKQRCEKEGEEVGQAGPEGKAELKGIIHSAMRSAGRYLSHMLAAADGACEAPPVFWRAIQFSLFDSVCAAKVTIVLLFQCGTRADCSRFYMYGVEIPD
jgi:hypothetical protein